MITRRTVGKRVRLARHQLELTQEQLAQRCGVTRQTIHLIEKDNYNPTLKVCLSLAHVLEKSLDELFWNDAPEGVAK